MKEEEIILIDISFMAVTEWSVTAKEQANFQYF